MKQAPSLVATITLAALVGAGCSSTSTVRSSGLVPRAQPALHGGQPHASQRSLALTLGGRLVSSRDPEVAADAEVGGIVVPQAQVQGGLRAQVTPWWNIGVLYDQGHAESATRANPGHPPVGGRDLIGMAYSIEGTPPIRAVPGLHVGISFETWLYSVPYVSYYDCVDRCWVASAEPRVEPSKNRELVPVLSAGLRPSYKRSRLAVFGILEGRNQPTILPPRFEAAEEDPVEFGQFVGIVGGGAELELPRGIRLLAHVYRVLGHSALEQGTSLAASLVVPVYFEPFPKPRPQPRRAAPPVEPGYPAWYPPPGSPPVSAPPSPPGPAPAPAPAPWSAPPP